VGIESLIPEPLKNPYRRLRSTIRNRGLGRSNADIFDAVYRHSLWGSAEDGRAYSGSGTYDPSVPQYVDYVRAFIAERRIESIAEIGCGDFTIGRRYAGDVGRYLGVDVSNIAIAQNIERFSGEGVEFACLDASEHDLPRSDLCIIRQVFQHLDNGSISRILKRTAAHQFVLVTEHLPAPSLLHKPNLDKISGPDTRLTFGSGVYVEEPPFGQRGETVLSLPVVEGQVGAGEVMRTTLIVNG
jgi:hypothetical protein